jgi:hypothetical protein
MVVGREARAQLLCKIDRRTQTRAIAINPAADVFAGTIKLWPNLVSE